MSAGTKTALVKFPERARTEPILRWAGGKRWLVDAVAPVIHAHLQQTGGRYIEPFAGGAAVALDLGLPGMIVSDLCEPLINCYRQASARPAVVHRMVEQYKARGTDKETYYEIRNAPRPKSALERAAWLFYLNALCYNGLFRENSKGGFNVPYGVRSRKQKLPGAHPLVSHSFITLDRLQAFAQATAETDFLHSDFAPVIARAKSGDLVFADSPYFGVFDKYLKEGFGVDQHIALARTLKTAMHRGAAFLATNNDTPEMRRLYRWAHLKSTGEHRRINRNAKDRGKVDCLLIASSKALLQGATLP
jgi:DNA adenine methylase